MTRRVQAVVAVVVAVALGACGGSGGGAPALQLGGGRGATGAGGRGGQLRIASYGGPVTLTTSGDLPAPRRWSYLAPDLGANPRTITGATSLTASAGVILGDDGATAATGLRVAAGATLTLLPDEDTDADGVPDRVGLGFDGGVLIEGTVQLGRVGGGRGAAGWDGAVGAMAIRPGGRLLAPGLDGDLAIDGGRGGTISLSVAGACSVEGLVDTRGGRGRSGGAGGNMEFVVSNGDIMVSGTSDSSGGEGLAGPGGAAGDNEIWGVWASHGTGDYWLTGAVVARGGQGTAGGGAGGWIYASGCETGEAFVSGLIDTSGGDATVDGPGGDAGEHEVDADQGRALSGGRHLARGGRGAGSGAGGDGAWVGFYAQMRSTTAGMDNPLVVKVDLDLRGGDGATGGIAGQLQLETGANTAGSNPLTLIAASADLTGGVGATAGGRGGSAAIFGLRGEDAAATWRIGAVRLGLPIDLRGGAASAGTGGDGGALDVSTSTSAVAAELDVPSADRLVLVSAPVTATGGAGVDGGAGGEISGFEHLAVSVTAALEASGGAATTGAGGAGGQVRLACDGVVTAGAAMADGGASAAGTGGAGGALVLESRGGATVRRGVASVRGGAGPTPGLDGQVTLDGAAAPLTGGQLRP
jgi:hypothetical protein